jgi:cytoskeletal protein CcmA (bactofilin family)
MSALLERDLPGDEVTDVVDDDFDPGAHFERWLAEIKAAKNQAIELASIKARMEQEIYVESRIGSNCELNFEGVLHFDGYSLGNVLSPSGTLVLTKRGRIEADIEVGTAIIDGFVTGNIVASERVELKSDARVKGQIFTPALSMRLGALLDGDCLFLTPASSSDMTLSGALDFQLDDPALSAELSDVLLEDTDEELEEFLLSA